MKFALLSLIFMVKVDISRAYVSVPENACPANLATCRVGDHQVITCFLSVEKIRVRILLRSNIRLLTIYFF